MFVDSSDSSGKGHHVAIAMGASFGLAFLLIVIVGSLIWWRYRRNKQIFFDVNGEFLITFPYMKLILC